MTKGKIKEQIGDIDVNSKYRVVYTDPETNRPTYHIMSSSEYATFLLEHDNASFSEMIMIGKVWIKKSKIEGMKKEAVQRKALNSVDYVSTRYEECAERGFSGDEKKEWKHCFDLAFKYFSGAPGIIILAITKTFFNDPDKTKQFT